MIVERKSVILILTAIALTSAWCVPVVVSQEGDQSSAFLPPAVKGSHFSELRDQSPFTRTLNLSDSLILTGIAHVDNIQVATLLNKETKETFVVSGEANSQGWKMVELNSNTDLEKVAAKISVDGGQVVTVRYGEWQLKPGEARPGAGSGNASGNSDGRQERRGPPQEVREKIAKLSDEQRSKLFSKFHEIRQKHPNLSEDDRRAMFRKMLDKVSDEKS